MMICFCCILLDTDLIKALQKMKKKKAMVSKATTFWTAWLMTILEHGGGLCGLGREEGHELVS